jgi:hypothetical protein
MYGRECRMRRNRNGRNVQLGPGKQTAKTGVWFGEIERKLAKLSKTTSLTVLPLNYFMNLCF